MTQFFASLLMPLPLFFLAIVVAFIMRKSKKKTAYRIGFTALILFYIFTTPLLASIFINLVEAPYHNQIKPESEISAIVIPGGYTAQFGSHGEVMVQALPGIDRLFTGIRLYKEGIAPIVLLSGGSNNPEHEMPESERIKKYLISFWDIDEDDILLENKSMNTKENARYSADIFDTMDMEKTILLVTSVTHMRRARLAFERNGFEIIPYATDFTFLQVRFPSMLIPSSSALNYNSGIIREYLGLMYYSLVV